MGDDHDDDGPRFKPPHMPNYDLNGKIMLTAIISLSIVVILVTVLHIYARCVLRQQARRRAAIRQLGIAITSQVHSIEPAKTGLDPTVIAALPMFLYKQSDQTNDHEQREVECAVCLSILEDGEMARVLPNCNHTFHAECIDRWFGSNSTCPICRTKVEPQQLCLSTSEGGSTGVVVPPSAPPLNSGVGNMEGTSDGGAQSIKTNGSTSRLSSFRKMLGKEKLPSEGDSGGLVSPSAPPLNSNMEGTSSSRLSSFRKMLSREKSSKRIQSCAEEEMEDIERQ